MIDSTYRLPFDQYQRYRLIAEVVPILEGDGPLLSIVEVGGYPPKLGAFLPEHQITVVDVQDDEAPNYVVAEGTDLPFPDGAFGLAISLDTIEHVVPERRELFVSELCRVAQSCVIVAAPFAADAVKAADRAIYEFIRSQAGYDHRYIKEHIDLELPDMVNTLTRMVDRGLDVQVLPSGRLDRWLFMMAAYYTLDADPGLKDALPLLMEAYNRAYYDYDKAEPAYRHFLVGAYEGLGRRWSELADLASGESVESASVDNRSVAMVLELARTIAVKSKNSEIEALQDQLADKEREIEALKQHNDALQQFMDKVKALPLYSAYKKLLKPLVKK